MNGRIHLFLAAFCVASMSHARLMTWEPGDYVQDGLVAHFDGIRNAGASLPHDPAAKVWKDLKSGNYLTFAGTSAAAIATGAWTGGNSYSFAYSYGYMANAIDLGADITVQLVLDAGFEAQQAAYADTKSRATYPTYVGIIDDFGVFTRLNRYNAERSPEWKNDTWCGTRVKDAEWNEKYMNLITTDDFSYLGCTAAYENETVRTKSVAFDGYQWSLSGAHYAQSAIDVDKRLAFSRYYSARFYNRPLTVAELERNRRIDEVRFRGVIYTNVVVAASGYAGVSGAEAAGIYAVDSEHTFTAANVTVGDVTYAANGYTLETWAGAAWGTAQVFEGSSYTYIVTDGSPVVRLTWLWKPVRGIRSAASYDAGDYVQGGLVAQYDGIRNSGAALPHDPAATVWKDLKSGNYMTFNGTTDVAAATGDWSGGNSYSFAGFSYARMAESISLGSNITVQLAVDVDSEVQRKAWETALFADWLKTATYFSAEKDYGVFANVYTETQYDYLQWKDYNKTGSGAGNRAHIRGWRGEYLTAVTTDEKAYLFQTEDYKDDDSIVRTKWGSFDNYRWSVGGAHYDDSPDGINQRLTIGRYYSARFYNRPLTSEELAWNRRVDEIRFRGVVNTNVIVQSSKSAASGMQPNGVYEVIEEGVFCAAPVIYESNGQRFAYVPVGYTLERLVDGAWSAPESHEGTAYTHSVAREPGIVRLTWTWHRKCGGLNIVIR